MKVLKKILVSTLALAMLLSSANVYAADEPAADEVSLVNVALNGSIEASQVTTDNGALHGAEKIIDGDVTLSSYWDSGILEEDKSEISVVLDLNDEYDVRQINIINFWGKVWQQSYDRWYKYDIYTSLDGNDWTLSVSKHTETPSVSSGDLYNIDSQGKIRYVKVVCLESNNADPTIAHIVELQVFAESDEKPEESTNIALNKPVKAIGSNADKITDGDMSAYWDGGMSPSSFVIDLEDYYDVSSFHAYPYVDGKRGYTYEIALSDNGISYEKAAEKTEPETETNAGQKFVLDTPKVARYVKVTMFGNTVNEYAHMREFEVYGTKHEGEYTPSVPVDKEDPDNIAFGKPTRANTGKIISSNVVDGDLNTSWSASMFPANVDIDLGKAYDLKDVELYFPNVDEQYYKYTVYGSMDGVNFDRYVQKRNNELSLADGDSYDLSGKTARYIRVNVEFVSVGANAYLSEVKLHGTESSQTASDRPDIELTSFEDSQYAAPITEEDTINEVYALIERRLGAEFKDWFTFELEDADQDYFEISDVDGKIHIKGNKGVSLTSGLYYYLKYFCEVQITQQTDTVEFMPETIVPVNEAVYKATTFDVRYAYNYCTLSYTNAFYGEEDWLREIDWLALNGVNLVLDTTGQEAVWIEFLTSIGYSVDDAKSWLTGPSYTAWQFMSNMENYGGPIHDQYVADRLELARKNQRMMRALGMDVVLQGYAGMIPSDYNTVADTTDPDCKAIADAMMAQGTWGGQFTRPAMLKTDAPVFEKVAEKFYAAQEKMLGDITDYYAVDPFHEGGIRPSNLSETDISRLVLGEMMKYDEDAVWTIQSWEGNPTKELLDGLGDNREEHALILDLTSTTQPHYNDSKWGDEFYGTPWIYCMLDNFGDRPGVHGELSVIASDVNRAKESSEHMKGIGITPEGTKLNPVNYELFFETVWSDGEIDLGSWIKDYITRRYGTFSQDAYDGWMYLLESAYGSSGAHWGGTNSIANYRPDRGTPILGQNSGLPYDYEKFTKAVEKLLVDYDELSSSEAYLYDIAALLNQQLQNSQLTYYNNFQDAYREKDLEAFNENAEKFLESISLVDQISATQKDELLGNWIGKAYDRSEDYDDFSKDAFEFNAKALITTWGGRNCAKTLGDYAYRQYAGLEENYVKPRWTKYIDTLRQNLENGTNNTISYDTYFNDMWDFILDDEVYTRETTDAKSELARLSEIVMEDYTFHKVELPVTDDNVAVNASVTSSNGADAGHPLSNVIDNDDDTLWVAINGSTPSSVTVDLGSVYPVYDIQVAFEKSPAADRGLFVDYKVEAEINGEWVEIGSGATTKEQQIFDHILEDQPGVEKVRVTVTSVDGSLYPAIAEIRVYSSKGIQTADADLAAKTETEWQIGSELKTVGDLKAVLYAEVGEISVCDGDIVLTDDSLLETGYTVMLKASGVVIENMPVRLSADMKELDEIVAQAGSLNKNDYTAESWKALSDALASAKELLEGNPTQEEVDAAVKALQEAIKGLETVNKGEDPTTPDVPNKPAGEDDTDKPAEKEPDKGQSAVETGDFTDISLAAGMIFVSLAVVCCLGYRKKHF